MKIINCQYAGVLGGSIVLWNLLEDIPGHPMGSTLSTATLTNMGYVAGEEELDRAYHLILSDPTADEELKKQIEDYLSVHEEMIIIPIKPKRYFPVEISKPVPGYDSCTNLHLQVWIREWFYSVKGRYPEDGFVAWACETMERNGAVLLKHEPEIQP